MTSSTHRMRNPAKKTVRLPTAYGFGMLTGLASAFILLPTAAAIAYAQADPAATAMPAAVTTLYLSVLLSGAAAARKSEAPLLAAGLCGGTFFLLTLIFALFPIGSASCGFSTPVNVLTHLAVPAAALLGALLGRRREKRPTSHQRKRRR